MADQHGVEFPWVGGAPPLHPLHTWQNISYFAVNSAQLWCTLDEQLAERAVIAWDVRDSGLPMGVSRQKDGF